MESDWTYFIHMNPLWKLKYSNITSHYNFCSGKVLNYSEIYGFKTEQLFRERDAEKEDPQMYDLL